MMSGVLQHTILELKNGVLKHTLRGAISAI